MAWTQSDLTALEASMRDGLLTVRTADRTITFQSMADMRKLRREMQAEIATTAGTPRAARTTRVYQSGRGL